MVRPSRRRSTNIELLRIRTIIQNRISLLELQNNRGRFDEEERNTGTHETFSVVAVDAAVLGAIFRILSVRAHFNT